jgi:hypothetical protein
MYHTSQKEHTANITTGRKKDLFCPYVVIRWSTDFFLTLFFFLAASSFDKIPLGFKMNVIVSW